MIHFDFSKALELIKLGETVCLSIENKTREYSLEDGMIVCKVGNTTYAIKQFYIDAILSEKWYLKI